MHYTYKPARLVKASNLWYIDYYQSDPVTLKMVRYRETLGMNRIKDIEQRQIKADLRISDLNNNLLPSGYPYNKIYTNVKLVDALSIAFKAKKSTRANTNKTYNTLNNRLSKYIREKKMQQIDVPQFSKLHAFEFMDGIAASGVAGVTYNNYKTHAVIIWNEMESRGYVRVNPFKGMANKKEDKKKRQPLSMYQKNVVMEALQDQKPNLCLPVLLIYYCFIRPKELRMLRVGDVNLSEYIITVRSDISKNRTTEHVTIPDHLHDAIRSHIGNSPYKHYLFSTDLVPGAESLSRDYMSKQHKRVVDTLTADIETAGVTLYSWKDTGASDMLKHGVNVEELRSQLRHKCLNTTQRYLTGFGQVNKNIKGLPNILTRQ